MPPATERTPHTKDNSRPEAAFARSVRLCATAAALLLSILMGGAVADDRQGTAINCDIQNGPCTQEIAGKKVTLEVSPRPVRAMQDLLFRVSMEGVANAAEPPYVDLNMVAMDMGPNRVLLKWNGKDAYEGQGVIVR